MSEELTLSLVEEGGRNKEVEEEETGGRDKEGHCRNCGEDFLVTPTGEMETGDMVEENGQGSDEPDDLETSDLMDGTGRVFGGPRILLPEIKEPPNSPISKVVCAVVKSIKIH